MKPVILTVDDDPQVLSFLYHIILQICHKDLSTEQ